MTAKNKYRAAEIFVKKVLEKHGSKIEDVILFGSLARNETREDSDVDMLVVIKNEDYRLRREIIGIAFDVLLETGENISAKIISREELERLKEFSFFKRVSLEGVRLV